MSLFRDTSSLVRRPLWLALVAIIVAVYAALLISCTTQSALPQINGASQTSSEEAEATSYAAKPTATAIPTRAPVAMLVPVQTPESQVANAPKPRGYLTTPLELVRISEKANQGIEPYKSAVADVLKYAKQDWQFQLDSNVSCSDKNNPAWNDNESGTRVIYAKALAYHLTNNSQYAEDVKNILQRIMTEVKTISLDEQQCRLNFSWGTPELVASADLIEAYWYSKTCTGPVSTAYSDTNIISGNCKMLFQNWLVKNPYYVVSYSVKNAQSNWGAAATNTMAYIADYLWDRPQVQLLQRNPRQVNDGKDESLTPNQAYRYANQVALDRMNGYGVEYGSSDSCDFLSGPQQNSNFPPVKSQITADGIIPEDARRQEYCNVPKYNGQYENYPQLHIGHNIQQCELMLRRGDRSCFDNIDNTDIPNYSFVGPDGITRTTHLYPGRGSLERAINAIIVDSSTKWQHDSALEVAYRYYYIYHKLPGFDRWFSQINRPSSCDQDICFGTLTHGFAQGETPKLPPVVSPP